MKVKDLIAELQKCDPEATVIREGDISFLEVKKVDGDWADGFNSLPADSEFRKFGPSVVEII